MYQIVLECILASMLAFIAWLCISDWLQPDSIETISRQKSTRIVDSTLYGDDFTIYNGKSIELRNIYKLSDQPSSSILKFSLQNSARISKIELQDRKVWNWKLDSKFKERITFYKKNWKQLGVCEYHFRWPAEEKEEKFKEIWFHYGTGNATWFSTYQQSIPNYPMNPASHLPFTSLNSLPLQQYATAPNLPHSITEHIFLNTNGFALILPPQSPLFLRYNPNRGDPIIGISVQNRLPYLTSNEAPIRSYRDVKFSIISGLNLRTVYDAISSTLDYYIQKPVSIPDERLFTYPSWICAPKLWIKKSCTQEYSEKSIRKFTRELKFHGFENSLIILDSGWEASANYLTINKKLFPEPRRFIRRLHKRGFRVGLTIDPNVPLECVNFLNKKYFVKSALNSTPLISDEGQKFLLDFTNPESIRWFLDRFEKLRNLSDGSSLLNCNRRSFRRSKPKTVHGFDAFQFAPLRAYSESFQFYDSTVQRYPNLFLEKYMHVIAKLAPESVNIYQNGYKSQDLSGFVRISERFGNWFEHYGGLRSLIPAVLTLSLSGYSFIIPDVIGGRFGRASRELYIRWVQACAFMPTMLFVVPPWDYENNSDEFDVLKITQRYVNLHILHSRIIIELAQRRVDYGEPIIRPLWYVAPDDSQTFKIKDQFMLGNDILVAPVVQMDARARTVYLPEGDWIDHKGVCHTGPEQICVEAPIDELPYFKRQFQVHNKNVSQLDIRQLDK